MCMYALAVFMFEHHIWAWCLWILEGKADSLGLELQVIVNCQLDFEN